MNAAANYPKRLIEVDLPIRRISTHARREKSIRHGHISTLHIWWARRPLAACRAVILAALWPDPADPHCPPAFREEVRRRMLAWARDCIAKTSPESYRRLMTIRNNPAVLDDPVELRKVLLDFIADFANWDNSTDQDYLETSRALVRTAHEALGGEPGTRPLVVDPFAGGGSIPLEALRVGADAFASDLNPVAVLLNKVVLEYIPRYGQQLADEVRRWGNWIKEQAERELAEFYPRDPDGATPIAYLWARTILSEAPGQGEVPVEVPLMRSLWLAKKPGRYWALRWVRDGRGQVQTETVEVTYADGTTRLVRRPLLEIFEPVSAAEVEEGTVKRGSATCPVTGYTTPVKSVREQLKKRRGGAADARLFCVVTTRPGQQGRFYRLPTDRDLDAVRKAAEELERRQRQHRGALSLVPDEPTPMGGGSGAGRAFSQRNYGMDQFGDLFNPRQALALTTLARLVQRAGEQWALEHEKGLATAVQTCLALALDKQADSNSSLCSWRSTSQDIGHTFGRQALPMMWDFVEGNILSGATRDWLNAVEGSLKALESLDPKIEIGKSEKASASIHPLPNDVAAGFITDPPYYDAVPYADLSDFFIVWLRRTVGNRHAELLRDSLAPKDDECIVDEIKSKDKVYFESTIGRAMAEGRRILSPNGIGVVVFAHKSTAGWEALLQAMVDAGWRVTGSWPIDTEMGTRLRARDSAALASSVHLVCRPRENPDGSLRIDEIGDWRDVLNELPKRVHEWLPRLAEEGIVGADAIFACLGPALEVFSRYSRVEKASGEPVTLREYLEHVWAAVAREALSTIFTGADATGFEEDARLTAMWLWTLSAGRANSNGNSVAEETDDEEGDNGKAVSVGFVLEYDAARKIAQGLGAHLEKLAHVVQVKGETARLLRVTERTRYLFGKDQAQATTAKPKKKKTQISLFAELEEVEEEADWGVKAAPKPGTTVLDRVHQAMILFASGRAEALKRFLVEEGAGNDARFWRLAQALSALYPPGTDEKRWVDGILARKKGLGLF